MLVYQRVSICSNGKSMKMGHGIRVAQEFQPSMARVHQILLAFSFQHVCLCDNWVLQNLVVDHHFPQKNSIFLGTHALSGQTKHHILLVIYICKPYTHEYPHSGVIRIYR